MVSALALVPRSPEWHADRQQGIGSSDAPIITGDAPRSWGDPIELLQRLYGEKVGLLDAAERPDNALMEWGRRLEPEIAAWYVEQTGRRLQKIGRLHHREHPWMTASLDRRTIGVRPARLIEIKTAPFGGDEWGEPGTAEIPTHVLVQTQHQLAVSGYEVADVPVLIRGHDARIYTVERDDAFIADLIDLEAEFMACVREGRVPDYSGLLDERKRVRPLGESEIEADPELDALIETAWHATEARKAAEKTEREIKSTLADAADPYTRVRGSAVDLVYAPNKPTTKVAWEHVAAAYRKVIESIPREIGGVIPIQQDADLDAIESTFTVEQAGARPIRFTEHKGEKE